MDVHGLFPLAAAALLACAGCRGKRLHEVRLTDLIGHMADRSYIARLNVPRTAIVTSTDPSGGNDDYNHFLREGPPGWEVIADLQGPGYVTRLWFTGARDGSQGLRFYFDGEKSPRVETTVGDWCGGAAPLVPPLAAYENYCWYSLVPVPYRRRLVIMLQRGTVPGRQEKLFYQVNYAALRRGETIRSFRGTYSAEERAALEKVAAAWKQDDIWEGLPGAEIEPVEVDLAPGDAADVFSQVGPAMITGLAFTPDWDAVGDVAERERVLRDVLVRLFWDGSAEASVEAPLGDFCGVMWRRTRYHSFYFGMRGGTLYACFPMPFRQQARLCLVNQGKAHLHLRVACRVRELEQWDGGWGYLHAAWNRSGPEAVGRQHPILNVTGARGRYVGCCLSVTSLDGSWWILEGDESIRRDSEVTRGWLGTGLEDYFNGGWYYQNAMARALNGVPFKAPFRVVQYRLHQMDAVTFGDSVDMYFERGPRNASHGWMESVAWYYCADPQPTAGHVGGAVDRRPPEDPASRATVMMELLNSERLGDIQAAADRIDTYLAEHPEFPHRRRLLLRQAEYRAGKSGFAGVAEMFRRAAAEAADTPAGKEARDLLWFYGMETSGVRVAASELKRRALLAAYCNMPTTIVLDGRKVGETGDPSRMKVWRVAVTPGRHVLCLAAGRRRYPDWVQACLRTHYGDVVSDPGWKWKFDPPGDWTRVSYDDSGWSRVGGTGVKGPPEAPYIWLEPNVFVGMQSAAVGLRAPEDWPAGARRVVFRRVFTLPSAGR